MKSTSSDAVVPFVALYRKYRPSRFADVVGQDHIIKVLSAAIERQEIAHAYLFAGSRGIGKTSIARIFAREIGTAEHDIYEIDAASHTGVDDVRALNEAVHTLPFSSKYKVYILDEAHMLSKAAFNALLKTIEEPPAHVIFVLATTEDHKIPETIISRCQVFRFAKPSQSILRDVVLKTAKAEGYTLERASAELIALLGDGSYRDTLGLLQKVVTASTDTKLSADEVELVTGAPASRLVNDFITALSQNDAATSLACIQEVAQRSTSARIFIKLVVQKLRSVLILRLSPNALESLKTAHTEEDFAFVEVIAKDVAKHSITSKTLSRMLQAYDEVERSYIPELPIELAVIELCGDQAKG